MIGIFDSGFGGLSVLRAIKKEIPKYDYMYLGDNARAPYGNKSQKLVYNYTTEALGFLFKKECELVIIACNTASVEVLRKIQREWLRRNYPSKRVLGVVVPTVEKIAEEVNREKKKNIIGIIGTELTIASGAYEKELNKINSNFKIYKKACPLLVPLIEEGWIRRRETKMILRYYLKSLKDLKIRKLILACTHYPLLLKQIKEVMGRGCIILNSPRNVAEKLKDYLNRHEEIEKKLSKRGRLIFYTTGDKKKFKSLGEKFFKEKIKKVRIVKF